MTTKWWQNRLRRYATDKGRKVADGTCYVGWSGVDTSDKVECMAEALYVALDDSKDTKTRARAYVQANEYAIQCRERHIGHDWHDCLAEARYVFETQLIRV